MSYVVVNNHRIGPVRSCDDYSAKPANLVVMVLKRLVNKIQSVSVICSLLKAILLFLYITLHATDWQCLAFRFTKVLGLQKTPTGTF